MFSSGEVASLRSGLAAKWLEAKSPSLQNIGIAEAPLAASRREGTRPKVSRRKDRMPARVRGDPEPSTDSDDSSFSMINDLRDLSLNADFSVNPRGHREARQK